MNTPHRLVWTFAPLLISLFCTHHALAESWPDPAPPSIGWGGEADVALIVAIEDYPDIPDIPGAKNNALAWERYLKNTLGLRDVVTLFNKDAAHYTIRTKLQEAAARAATSGGKLWFIFIGHGAPSRDGSDGLLVGAKADATAEGIYENSLSRSHILQIIQASQAQSVVVLDACFSGVYGEAGATITEGLQPLILVKINPAQGNILLLSAGKADQFTGPLPGDHRPAFSYLLVRALSGEGDENLDGQVSAGEAMAFVSDTFGRVVLGRAQNPQLEPSESAYWILTPQADPSVGCPAGQTRSADTSGQCCWPGQAFSKTQSQCIGQPTRCPQGLAKLADGCGPCKDGWVIEGDLCTARIQCPTGTTLQNGVCVQVQIQVQVQCPKDFILQHGECVPIVTPPPQHCPPDTHLENGECVADDMGDTKMSALHIGGWISTSAGAVLLATSVVTYVMASDLADELKSNALTQVEASNKNDQLDTLNITTVTTLGVGGAALLTGLLLLLDDDDTTTSEDATGLNMGGQLLNDNQGALLWLSGRF